METILVIGAAGKLGVPVAQELIKGYKIRVFDKDGQKLNDFFGKNFECIEGDIFDSISLNKAIDGCDGIHINLAGETEQYGTEEIVKATKTKGIQRITYLSSSYVDKDVLWSPHAKYKYFAEKAIIESKIPYTIFCTSLFMEILPKFIKGSKAIVYGKQTKPIHFIAIEDYAQMVRKSYQSISTLNKRLIIHGEDGYLLKKALDQYCALMHPEIKSISTIPFWKAKFKNKITGNTEMRNMIGILQFLEKAGEKGNSNETYDLLGKPIFTLQNWIEKQKTTAENHSTKQ